MATQKNRTVIGPTEAQIQRAVIRWWALAHKGLGCAHHDRLFAVPNGGGRDLITAANLKAEGVRRGVPDLILLTPRGEWHALALELKRAKGRLSPEQGVFLAELARDGYATAVCFGFDSAVRVIEHYLRLPPAGKGTP